MVQFLKAKQTSFVNKPVGVVGVNTGAIEAGQTLAKVGQRLATQFFADAEDEQKQLGKEVGLTLPVRDTDGKLLFQEVPTNLSEVAQNAATPVIQKRYEDALNVDIFTKINEIRDKSKTSSEFSNNVNNEMSSYIEQTKISGGSRYVGGMTQTIAKLSAQHFNAFLTEERNEANRIASLQALQITNINTNDLISLATNDFSNVDASNLDKMISGFEENALVISAENDNNFRINNLNTDKYGKASANAKSAVGKALANTLLKDADAGQAIAIQSYFFDGKSPEHLLGKDGKLSEKNQKIFDYINKSPFKDEIYKHIKTSVELITKDQNRFRSDQNYKDQQITKQNAKLRESTPIRMNSDKWLNSKVAEINNITDEILNSETISEDQKNKVTNWQTSLYSASSDEGISINVDGKSQRIMIGKTQANDVLVKAMLRGIENTIISTKEFGTLDGKIKLRNALTNNSTIGLNENEKKIVKKIKDITNLSIRSETLISNIARNLNNNINDQRAALADSNANKEKEAVYNSFRGIPTAIKFKNNDKELKIMDQILEINPTYFDGQFQKDLKDGDPKARVINEGLEKGHFTNSFLTYITKSITSNNSLQVRNALGFLNKYSQLTKGGQTVDVLQKSLDSEVYAVLKVASDLIPMYEGQTSFFGVQGEGPNGNVTAGQMMLKINDVYQKRESKENNEVFKTNLKRITGEYKTSYSYLLSENFDGVEAKELRFIVDAAASMGLSKTKTDLILTYAKENIYLDGENLIFDGLGSGDDNTRSKHAFMAVFNEDQVPVIRGFIQNQLDNLVHKNEKGRTVGRYVLNYKPTILDAKGYAKYPMGADVGQTKDINIEDTIVKLQPVQYGSSKTDVGYVAVVKNIRTGDMNPIRLPNGSIMKFYADDLANIDTIYGED